MMDLEKSSNCDADYLAFIDGPTTGHAKLDTLCGFKKNIGLKSTSNELLVLFHSNENNVGTGFNMTYS